MFILYTISVRLVIKRLCIRIIVMLTKSIVLPHEWGKLSVEMMRLKWICVYDDLGSQQKAMLTIVTTHFHKERYTTTSSQILFEHDPYVSP